MENSCLTKEERNNVLKALTVLKVPPVKWVVLLSLPICFLGLYFGTVTIFDGVLLISQTLINSIESKVRGLLYVVMGLALVYGSYIPFALFVNYIFYLQYKRAINKPGIIATLTSSEIIAENGNIVPLSQVKSVVQSEKFYIFIQKKNTIYLVKTSTINNQDILNLRQKFGFKLKYGFQL